ncbi:DUF551 domain-containing protein [Enterobacter kobei]|uniref:DUF551 domain-containing protein n=1 Tax=Enterobacter kobei TaxID=208224 RepID=UPI00298D0BFF|nr:DUF551 domain-containing protein [Enterobacter kobei]
MEFTKEQLIEQAKKNIEVLRGAAERIPGASDAAVIHLKLARIALASLEAEAVADVVAWSSPNEERTCDIRLRRHDITAGPLYTAPPVPVSVKIPPEKPHTDGPLADGWNACRATMLQGADTELQRKAAIHDALCQKYNVESLTDFVDWQRNHIAELEAALPAPVGEGEAAVMPDYPGYVMTQRECYQAGKKAGLAEPVTTANKLPEGWVACSERMPEDRESVLLWDIDLDDACSGHYSHQTGNFYQAGMIIDNEITHWMPLPAAPHQEAS